MPATRKPTNSTTAASADAPGWAELATDAKTLSADRSIAAYAIALGDETDAGLLGRVFPAARNVPGDEVGDYLSRIDAELLNFKAAEKLRADATGTVTAAWTGLDPTSLVANGAAKPTLSLTSNLVAAPVEVSGLSVALATGDITATGLPESVLLGPGETRQLPVDLTANGLTAESALEVDGTVDSPWREAAAAFGVALAPQLDATTVTLTPAPSAPAAPAATELPAWLVPAAAAGSAALVLLLGLLALLRRRGELRGAFTITRDGAPVREFMLTGPKVELARAAGPAASGIVGTISPAAPRTAR